MTDISKCAGLGCDRKETCFKYLMPTGHCQTWMQQPDPETCQEYWPYGTNDEKIVENEQKDVKNTQK